MVHILDWVHIHDIFLLSHMREHVTFAVVPVYFYAVFWMLYFYHNYIPTQFFTLSISDSPICNPLCIIWVWIKKMNEWMNEWTPPLTATWSCTGPNRMKHKTTYIYKIKSVTTTRSSWCYAYRTTFSSTIKRKLTATKQDGWSTININLPTAKCTGHKLRNDAQIK